MPSRILLFLIMIAGGCSSHKKDKLRQKYPNLKQLSPPGAQKYRPSNTYIDSVKIITVNNDHAVLIAGKLANGCTKLQKAGHAFQHDSLTISLTAWKPASKECSQALVPFQFIYNKVPPTKLGETKFIRINQKHFDIN